MLLFLWIMQVYFLSIQSFHFFILISFIIYLGATNKSHFIIDAFCGETVRVGRLDKCDSAYLRTGHSKTKADRLFANIATALTPVDYFNHL